MCYLQTTHNFNRIGNYRKTFFAPFNLYNFLNCCRKFTNHRSNSKETTKANLTRLKEIGCLLNKSGKTVKYQLRMFEKPGALCKYGKILKEICKKEARNKAFEIFEFF